MAVLGLHFCARASSSCGERGPLFIAMHRPFTVVASLVAEHRLQTRRLSSCGARAQLLHGMWDLPRPGLEPMSPALAGRLSTTAPPGKPLSVYFWRNEHTAIAYSGCGTRASDDLGSRGPATFLSCLSRQVTDQQQPNMERTALAQHTVLQLCPGIKSGQLD